MPKVELIQTPDQSLLKKLSGFLPLLAAQLPEAAIAAAFIAIFEIMTGCLGGHNPKGKGHSGRSCLGLLAHAADIQGASTLQEDVHLLRLDLHRADRKIMMGIACRARAHLSCTSSDIESHLEWQSIPSW